MLINCAGLVFAKLARPQKRAETVMFSRRACICKRDNHLALMFRVGDMRSSHIIGDTDTLLSDRYVFTYILFQNGTFSLNFSFEIDYICTSFKHDPFFVRISLNAAT